MLCCAVLLAGLAAHPSRAAVPASLYIEQLTSPELGARVAEGMTTILVPIGGTEQSGAHIVLGKHNLRATVLAGQIAQTLGHALVAPVIAYVPEGRIDPPTSHMRFAGTISIPDAAFDAMLEATARSFRQHGFRDIVFLGDHSSYQKNEERVADRLNREWSTLPAQRSTRVHALVEYYRAAQHGFAALLAKRGYSAAEIGIHAGLADTSLELAIDESQVRKELMARTPPQVEQDGVIGDPRRASAELGRLGVALIVETSVAALKERMRPH